MQIDGQTKLTRLLETYPWLLDELARTEPRSKPFLAMMNTPLAKTAPSSAPVMAQSLSCRTIWFTLRLRW